MYTFYIFYTWTNEKHEWKNHHSSIWSWYQSYGTKILDILSTVVKQVEDDVISLVLVALSPPPVSDFLQHRKKFHDPNVINFSFLSRFSKLNCDNEDRNRQDPWSVRPTATPPSRIVVVSPRLDLRLLNLTISQLGLALNFSEQWHWATWSTVALPSATVQRHSYMRVGSARSSDDKAPPTGP